jgi:hypothetical protein
VPPCGRAGRPSPFSLQEIRGVSRATFAILEAIRSRREIELG